MFPPLFSFLSQLRTEEDRAALALPWGRAQQGEQGRALVSQSIFPPTLFIADLGNFPGGGEKVSTGERNESI